MLTFLDQISRYLKVAEHIGLIAAMLVAMGYIKLYNKERQNREISEIAEKGLPPGVAAKLWIENRRLIQAVKDADGKTRVVIRYIPAEGGAQVITKERDEAVKKYQALLEQLRTAKDPKEVEKIEEKLKIVSKEIEKPPEVIIRDKGFTSRFGYGMVWTPGHSTDIALKSGGKLSLPIVPDLSWKYGFWKRWSTTVHINPGYFGPGVTRHIDDFTPRWLHADNLEFAISGGPAWSGGWQAGTGLRTNF